jgi:hypothetical protein
MRLIAVTFVTTGRLFAADASPAPASPDGYKAKTVPVKVNGKTVPIRVVENDPFKNVSSSNSTDKYDPRAINFSTRSAMADKSFSLSSSSLSQTSSDFKNEGQDTFITKPYTGNTSSSVPNLDAKTSFTTAGGYNRNATGFNKGYNTSTADAGQTRTAMFASNTSTTTADQNRTALLGSRTVSIAASPLGEKTFQGPEADAARRTLSRTDDGKIYVSELPNRPLTIDEVRNLINHGFKPNTDIKPSEPSKPLNDPNYKPEPLRDTPSPASDDDKNDPVPPPGTMAVPQAPENSEPLPQP